MSNSYVSPSPAVPWTSKWYTLFMKFTVQGPHTIRIWNKFTGRCLWCHTLDGSHHGSFIRYVKLRVVSAPAMPGTFFPPPQVSDSDMHHDTCVTHVPWCMPGSLTSGFLWSRWRGKRSRHSRRMRDPQFTYLVRGQLRDKRHTQDYWDTMHPGCCFNFKTIF